MTVGIQVYRGNFALALVVRLPALQFDVFNWLIIAALLVAVVGLPLGLLPALAGASLGLAFTVGLLLAELVEVWGWHNRTR